MSSISEQMYYLAMTERPATVGPPRSQRWTAVPGRGLSLAQIAVYGLFAGVIISVNAATANSDYWVRLASGRLVVEQHIIPRHDPFTFTARGADWLDHEWLLGGAMYAISNVSFELLVIVSAALALAPFMMMHRLALVSRKNDWLLLALVSIAIFAAWRNFGIRPQLVNPIFFAGLIWLIDLRRRTGSRVIWLAIPLSLAWANLQAGFVVGPAVVAAWFAICLVERRDRLTSLCVLAGALIAPLFNAYGFELYQYTLASSLSGNTDRALVPEWQTPDFHDALNAPTLLGLLVLVYFGTRTQDHFRQALALGTAVATLVSARFGPFLALSLIYVVAPQLPQIRLPSIGALVFAFIAPLVGAMLTVAVVRTSAQDPPLGKVPVEGLAWLESNAPDARVYAMQSWGSYLTFEGWPAFFDTRTHQVFSEELIAEYHKVERTRGDWHSVLDKWDIEYVMMPPESSLAEALDAAGWTRVFEGDIEVVWRRPAGAQ